MAKDIEKVSEEQASEEMVTISKDALDSLISRVARLEKGGGVVKPKRITDREIRIKIFDDKPVVRVGKVITKFPGKANETNDLEIFVLNGDKEQKHTVNYLEFLNSGEHVMGKIINQIATENEEIVGYTRSETFDLGKMQNKYGDEVPMIVKSVTYKYEVELLNGEMAGKKITIDQSASNI